MATKRITELITSSLQKTTIDNNLYPKSESFLEFGVLTTKKADELLADMKLDVDTFSGIPKIIIQLGKEVIEYPQELLSQESLSDQNLLLENYVDELLAREDLSIKLERDILGGIFKWLNKDERLLLITTYKVDPTRHKHRNLPDSPFSLKLLRGDRNSPSYRRAMAKLIFNSLLELKKLKKEMFDAAYRRFLDHAFKPFEDFLYNERLSIKDPKYRPKCSYRKREKINNDDRSYIEVFDPPRQMTESGNSVIPTIEDKNKRVYSARISDFDEFDQLLIFEEGYKIDDWPDEGILLLEGDLASNRRKWNAIKQLKTRGLFDHARLADILIRPWGLPEVKPIPRTYFNENISHDNIESEPQAEAIDIALTNPDVTLIHGPPGTGKTTVIVEIIRHVIANGGRVIMCAPTHVAVDNVLERTAGMKGISAVRVGGRAYSEDELFKYLLSEKAKSLDLALPSFTKGNGSDKEIKGIQDRFTSLMESKGQKYLEQIAINQANLVCGTTIGIARFEPPDNDPIDFDVLIIDEASKATVMEFLVPAVRAKKWILVGDHRQLPPYVNEQEIRIYIQRYFDEFDVNKNYEEEEDSLDSNEILDLDEEDEDEEEVEERSIYDERTNQLIASLRRFHEELHALGEGQADRHWYRIVEAFDRNKKPIKSIEEMINLALGSCFHFFLQRLDESRNARLVVQHRMPSILANFLDQAIYHGNLKTSKDASTHGFILPEISSIGIKKINKPMIFLSTENIENKTEIAGRYKGYFNTGEAEVIAELIASFSSIDAISLGYDENNPMTIGVITYYAGQSKEINRHLRTVEEIEKIRGWRYQVKNKPIKIRVSIVDRFQGQEQDIVILSLTRSNQIGNIGFLKNLQRVNVSLSRAKQNLVIVGDAKFFENIRNKPVPILTKLAKYCKKNKLIHKVQEVTV